MVSFVGIYDYSKVDYVIKKIITFVAKPSLKVSKVIALTTYVWWWSVPYPNGSGKEAAFGYVGYSVIVACHKSGGSPLCHL